MQKVFLVLLTLFLINCSDSRKSAEILGKVAPEKFTVKFETTKGEFEIEVIRDFSPKAADRFFQLVKMGFYDKALFYRVVPGFVAQFGNTDTLARAPWETNTVPDEEVLYSNKKGTISFARYGKESRGFDMFIDLNDNLYLDTINFAGVTGFPAFGTVVKGMENVEKIFSGYGEATMQDQNMYTDHKLFKKTFPELDGIKKAYIIP
jgi:cyclophilin family peptidyl-prolyl cis-trans isomerase